MEPTAELLKKIAKKPQLLKLVDRYKKEFDIYQYLSDFVPKQLNTKDWERLLQTKSIEERVGLWNFVALTQKRAESDLERKEAAKQKLVDYYREQERIYNAGGMGYGAGLYRSHFDSFAQLKKNVELIYDVKQYNAQKLGDHPTIALDCQYLEEERFQQRSRLNNNLRVLLIENRTNSQNPFPLKLINADTSKPTVKDFINGLGYFSREDADEYLFPELHKNNPFLRANGEQPSNVVYISRYARDMLDGPLVHDTYILPVTFDLSRQSVGAARLGNFKLMSLPFRKYIKWKSGPMFLPQSSIYKVFETVSKTGGDWHRALHENVSKRHLISHEEHQKSPAPHREMAKFRQTEKQQVVNAIREAFNET